MRNLPVLLCVLAVCGAGLSAALYLRIGHSKQLLELQLSAAHTRAAGLAGKLATATEQGESLEKRLAALDSDLGETKSRLAATEARNVQLSRELTQSKRLVADHEQNERNFRGEIATLNRDLAATRASAVTQETVEACKATIAELERQLANARHGAVAPGTEGASTAVFATRPGESTPPLTATVVSVGTESAFVVLNCGATQGAAPGQFFSIQRGTETVALVLIGDVRPHFSVAQVQPGSLRGTLHKGDSAVLSQ